ncbi:hypothetical protein ACFE04_008425 [Oxalis oulophora]
MAKRKIINDDSNNDKKKAKSAMVELSKIAKKRKGKSVVVEPSSKKIAKSSSSSSSRKKKSQSIVMEEEKDDYKPIEEINQDDLLDDDDSEKEDETQVVVDVDEPIKRSRKLLSDKKKKKKKDVDFPSRFIGDHIPVDEAKQLYSKRYLEENEKPVATTEEEADALIQAKCHYRQAEIDGKTVLNLDDDVYVQGDGTKHYIAKIIEFFQSRDGKLFFVAQWFYRAEDTVVKAVHHHLIGDKHVFLSEVKNVNPLDCIVKKLNIARVETETSLNVKMEIAKNCDYFYDMMYLLPYSTFVKLPQAENEDGNDSSSTISSDVECSVVKLSKPKKSELTLLDLYAGCGAMSTGLCMGANMLDVKLVTKWAVDLNAYACQSAQLNHPETQVRNESVDDFLDLLKLWEKLCILFSLVKSSDPEKQYNPFPPEEDDEEEEAEEEDKEVKKGKGEVFEVEKIIGIRFGDLNYTGKPCLYFKFKMHEEHLTPDKENIVQWIGYSEAFDTWEPIDGLIDCRGKIQDFVIDGFKRGILPLPGAVDMICGGPPCQGVSGFNRFRNKENPLKDDKNRQLIVYMDVIDYLKPRFVLMENVVDLFKFAKGYLGRYAMGRLVQMNYQVRMGLMAAGAYGLPQYRSRCFVWGARPSETLPPFPLPTHDVVKRAHAPVQFEMNVVDFEEGQRLELRPRLYLGDAISDLPPVTNFEKRDEMPYKGEVLDEMPYKGEALDEMPYKGEALENRDKIYVGAALEKRDEIPCTGQALTDFQRLIRLSKNETLGLPSKVEETALLFDHRPLMLNKDDYVRVTHIPRRKRACFRDLAGLRVRPDNVVELDPNVPRPEIAPKKFLVPDYALTFTSGKSLKPFGRLWWDETVPTVVTRAEPHNQIILHPLQDRVLTVRENARLQGFPDYYKLMGNVKERYIQVGNAVAFPVGRALGYALGLSLGEMCGKEPVFKLPQGFPNL